MAQNLFRTVQRLLDDSGALEPSATIEVYSAGTSTPLTLYSDRALSTSAGYVVTADAAGAVPERWVADNVLFKFVYKDADGATKYTRDYANDEDDPLSALVIDRAYVSLAAADTAAAALGAPVFVTQAHTIAVNTTFTSEMRFAGGTVSVNSGITATFNGGITGDEHRQIFSGAGLVVLGAKTTRAVCEYWGGGPGLASGAAINKMIAATATAKVVNHFFFGAASYLIETNLTEMAANHPITSDAGATFDASGATNCFTFATGNGGPHVLPNIAGFTGWGVKAKGSDLLNVSCHAINNCGDGIVLEALNATHGNALNNKFVVQVMGGNTNDLRIIADNNACVMQGNEFRINASLQSTRTVFFDASGLTPSWDRNIVMLGTIDPTISKANARGLISNATDVPALIFRVEAWLGGFNTSTGKIIEGNFNGLNCFINFAQSLSNYAMWALTGTAITMKSSPGNGSAASVVTAAAAVNSRASFNAGTPIGTNRIRLRMTLASDLAANAFRNFYAYHPFADGTTDSFQWKPSDMNGAIVTAMVPGANANEIVIQVCNISGANMVSGLNLDGLLGVGLP